MGHVCLQLKGHWMTELTWMHLATLLGYFGRECDNEPLRGVSAHLPSFLYSRPCLNGCVCVWGFQETAAEGQRFLTLSFVRRLGLFPVGGTNPAQSQPFTGCRCVTNGNLRMLFAHSIPCLLADHRARVSAQTSTVALCVLDLPSFPWVVSYVLLDGDWRP